MFPACVLLAAISASASDPAQPEPAFELSLIPIRGMISVTTQGNPSYYQEEISAMAEMGVNVINTFHGWPSSSDIFLNLTDEANMGCIPSIPLICWIRFGDPPYPKSGPLGWPNILEWLKLYGYVWPHIPEPFAQGANGTRPLTDEQLEQQVRETLEQIAGSPQHTSLLGFYAFDEPEANAPGAIDRIARAHAAFCRLGSSKDSALLPPTITGIFIWGSEGQAAAREYMTKATGYGDPPAPKPPVLMFDCYVLAYAIGTGLSEYESYANSWVKIGDEFGVPVIVVPQGFTINRRPAPNELKAQAYLALAAGCKGINWFRFETLASMGRNMLDEVGEVNRDLEIIHPILMHLRKVDNAATISGCGGLFKAGTVNTFQHGQNLEKYLFIASKNVTGPDVARIAISKIKVGYVVERVLDCHTGRAVDFRQDEASLSFEFILGPGQGRLFQLEGDPSVPICEIVSALPIIGAVLPFLARGFGPDREKA